MMIDSGIVIDEPWIGRILRGEKEWEMRSNRTQVRGPIALIKKGSGTIVGTAEIVDCIGPLQKPEIYDSIAKHAIPEKIIDSGKVDKWNYAWVLSNIRALPAPVRYTHRKGAVVWVRLDAAVSQELNDLTNMTSELHVISSSVPKEPSEPATAQRKPAEVIQPPAELSGKLKIRAETSHPVSNDGSVFGRHLGGRGYYQIGAKGEEKKYKNFDEALDKLREMKVARWRRPNEKGNWGIVAAVRWE